MKGDKTYKLTNEEEIGLTRFVSKKAIKKIQAKANQETDEYLKIISEGDIIARGVCPRCASEDINHERINKFLFWVKTKKSRCMNCGLNYIITDFGNGDMSYQRIFPDKTKSRPTSPGGWGY